jgi:hypothetical protein
MTTAPHPRLPSRYPERCAGEPWCGGLRASVLVQTGPAQVQHAVAVGGIPRRFLTLTANPSCTYRALRSMAAVTPMPTIRRPTSWSTIERLAGSKMVDPTSLTVHPLTVKHIQRTASAFPQSAQHPG